MTMGMVQDTIWAAVKAGDRLTTIEWAWRLGLPWGVVLDTVREMAYVKTTPVVLEGNVVTIHPDQVPPPNTTVKVLRLTKKVTKVQNLTIQISLTDDQLKQLFQPDLDDSDEEAFKQVAWCLEDSVNEDEWHTVKSNTELETEIVKPGVTPDIIAHKDDIAIAVDILVEPDPI